jgi:hypothetical protein
MTIVLDTNCLLVALPKRSPYYWLWEGFLSKRFNYVTQPKYWKNITKY